jgi:hypothetical protein
VVVVNGGGFAEKECLTHPCPLFSGLETIISSIEDISKLRLSVMDISAGKLVPSLVLIILSDIIGESKMIAKFTEVFEILETSDKPNGGNVIYFKIVVKLSLSDCCTFEGYRGFDNTLRITDLHSAEIENTAVCSVWLATHKERVIEAINEHYHAKE